MAGTITHLVIADILLKELPLTITSKIKNRALFYCGNLAPDAVMARENYRREMKVHTHFKDGIPEDELAVPENFRLYRERFERFADNFLNNDRYDYGLYLGYVTHMLADEIFVLTVRDKHVQRARQSVTNSPYNDYKEYFTMFGHDVDLNDWKLVRDYQFSCDILDVIQSENDYEIEGYITNDELIRSKKFIIAKNFLTSHEYETPKVIKYQENAEYIQRAVKRIIGAVTDGSLTVTD